MKRVLGGLVAFCVVAATVGLLVTRADRATAAVTPGCVVDLAGALGWWRGEDDLVAEIGPDATGSVGFTDGLVDRAMAFDGTNSVSVAGVPVVSTGVTVEAWVKPIANGLIHSVMSRWDFPSADDSARSFNLLLFPSGQLVWSTDERSTRRPVDVAVSVPQIFDGGFHHVAATWTPTNVRIYLDGVEVMSAPSQAGLLNAAASTQVRIGSQAGLGSPMYFAGVIDEATVWERPLAPAEISAISGAGAAGKCSFVPTQLARLTANTPTPNSWFGVSVSVDGSTIVAGANSVDVFSGNADVYTKIGAFWFHQATLVALDRRITDFFGSSVSVDNDTIVVGAPGASPAGSDSGAAYVFTRTGSTWTQQAKLVPSDGAAFDQFGQSVDINADTIVVGSAFDDDAGADSGSAYVFTRTGSTWTQQYKLTPTDAAASDAFGTSVAISGDSVVAASAGDDDGGADSGSAYVFTRTGSTWTQQSKLTPTDPATADQFGHSVDIDGDVVIAGSPLDDDGGADSGSAYLFTRTGSAWAQTVKLIASDPGAGDLFGFSVATTGLTAVVGARSDSGLVPQTGSAYVFRNTASAWSELAKLTADDAGARDQLGSSVSVSGVTVVVGAPTEDDFGNNSGAAYLFVG